MIVLFTIEPLVSLTLSASSHWIATEVRVVVSYNLFFTKKSFSSFLLLLVGFKEPMDLLVDASFEPSYHSVCN